jgi:uncharacterized damage-inducible protein DinB
MYVTEANALPAEATLAPFYAGWDRYQSLLTDALAELGAEQLALNASPSLWPVWRLAAHIASTRVFWFRVWLGVDAPTLAQLEPWDEDGEPPRNAAELVQALDASWRMIQDCLDHWTPAMLADEFTRTRPWGPATLTRQWIIWHVLEHDLHHGGELFLTLGMHGLATPDL